MKRLNELVVSMQEAAASAGAPFQWVDGPLVTAMRQGDMILIDELNLAEDAVLERLNRSDFWILTGRLRCKAHVTCKMLTSNTLMHSIYVSC